jgi:hypothetical protein
MKPCVTKSLNPLVGSLLSHVCLPLTRKRKIHPACQAVVQKDERIALSRGLKAMLYTIDTRALPYLCITSVSSLWRMHNAA